jgi:predicted metalloprotease with PDZ domain
MIRETLFLDEQMNPVIAYSVTPLAARHVFAVSLIFTSRIDAPELYLPTWIAGSYMLRDFARHIVRMAAVTESGDALTLTPLGQSNWRVACAAGQTVRVDYEVFAHDMSVRTAFLDGSGGFFNGTSLFVGVPHLAGVAHAVHLHAPECDWQVATTLPRASTTPARGFGDYVARDYDELVDHPVRMGALTWLTFEAAGTPHEVAIAGHVPLLNRALLTRDLQAICAAQIEFFGAPAPFERYLFMVDARSSGYGGLEHRDSTALLCQRDDLPLASDALERREPYLTFLALCSHEYFHAWNVKRIKPAAFVPYDLSAPADTSLLWFFEGVTSYYDDLFLRRTAILTETQYLKRLTTTLNQVTQADGARTQTVADSGFYAWTKYYQTSPNTPNAVVSYYTKGALVAWCMDLYIRRASAQQHSLDDVMRDLWAAFGRDFYAPNHPQKGVVLADIVAACVRVAPDMAAVLERMLCSTDDLPLVELCAANGLNLTHEPANAPALGATVTKSDGGYQITRVANHGAAQQAGLAPDDLLIAFDQLKLTQPPEATLARYPLNHAITVHFWRDDALNHTILHNAPAPHGAYQLTAVQSVQKE